MAELVLSKLCKSFGRLKVIRDVDLEVADGEFCVFVGPSGCGKSTLLRLIAGLEDATSGEILIGGARVEHLPPAKRGVAMVFQSYALYPHMTARQNISFGLELAKQGREAMAAAVAKAAEILQLGPYLDRLPRELSGGQRQRVAIGRAIVRDPKLFLFDEPLSNLDAALRVQTRIEIAKLHREMGATTIYVTHDQVEAMTLADKIVVLRDGLVEQVGAPLDLYHAPANRFVAGFLGSPQMNFVEVTAKAADPAGVRVALPGGAEIVAATAEDAPEGEALTLGVRPEHLHLGRTEGAVTTEGRVEVVESLGDSHLLHLDLADGQRVILRGPGDPEIRVGETAPLCLDGADCHLFRADGTALTRRR